MKVLMVNKFLYKVGGCENYMFNIADQLLKHGHEVQYFGLSNSKNIVGNNFNLYVKSYDEKKIFNPFSLIFNKSAKRKMGLLLKKYQPDIVHINNIYYHLSSSIIDACKEQAIPVVMTVHDYQLVCPNHMLYRFDIDSLCQECVKKQNAKSCVKYSCIKNSKLKSYLGALESNYIHKKKPYNYVSLFICPSDFIKEQLVNGGYNKEQITVLRNPIEPQSFDNNVIKGDYALYFGRLSDEKGIDLLLNSWPENRQLFIAGTGPLEEKVKKYANENIKYLGFKTGEDLKELIKKAKFSLYPSKWFENCPLSIIESISLGTPVLSSNIGGNTELIDDGKTGLLFENNDKNDLRKKVEYLFSEKKALESMYKECASYKKVPYIEEYYETLVDEYKRLIDKQTQ